MNRRIVWLCVLLAGNAPAHAQLSPPTIVSTRPLGASAGETVTLEVKGTDLDAVNSVLFEEAGVRAEAPEAASKSVKARVTVPPGRAPGPLWFRLAGPRGASNPARLFVGGAGARTVAEVEPNRGFRAPQVVRLGDAIEAKVEPGDDVDVYAVDLKAGQVLAVDVIAARAGSGLDALVTVFGPDGRALAEADDTLGKGKDAAVAIKARQGGRHFVQVQDAEGKNRDGNVENKTIRPYRLELTASAPVPAIEVDEAEPNDDPRHARRLLIPGTCTARLDSGQGPEGDLDVFRLVPPPGAEGLYRISAVAAALGFGSAADPVLAVLDESGEVRQETDDAPGSRDPRILRAIDAKGLLVSVRDYHGRGGAPFVYRLEAEFLPARAIALTVDLGARAVPRGGRVALPIALERRDDAGPITILAGETPEGVAIAPLTIARGQNAALLVVSARADAPLGRVPLRLTTRDTGAVATVSYKERLPVAGAPADGWLCVVEPASLAVRLDPATSDLRVSPGGKLALKLALDRRGGTSGPVKLRFAADDGLGPIAEATVAKDAGSATVEIKARDDAAPGPCRLIVLARDETAPEAFAVAEVLTVQIEPKPKP